MYNYTNPIYIYILEDCIRVKNIMQGIICLYSTFEMFLVDLAVRKFFDLQYPCIFEYNKILEVLTFVIKKIVF